ncbi:formate dehydrogenase accessory sulfurtransferase FdhD [Ilyomonas limi]|uniref:Sulfur carrier protein FdhD n=1 Tax=Ilyomonas limi TaxID=2575867 RepID=A0A4U3L7F5_9BACT|nr:formate dehydrogenase accessory sulfurtransferase FdhD [Ilyomonas limi]TKK70962.1 formate dehydrogenase accessory sulfurtransferase FdhD [Ilyomonas limi]
MSRSSISSKSVIKVHGTTTRHVNDVLAAEEPLEIRLCFGAFLQRKQQNISVTMRTPGNDFELATGFLFTEGIIKEAADIHSIKHCNGLHENVVKVELKEEVTVDISKLERNFYTTSSCGVCGKSSIEAVRTVCRLPAIKNNELQFSSATIYTLPALLRSTQAIFENTGGLHGCALFDTSGNLILAREDVGRHNAVDKLIGATLAQSLFPLDRYLLLLSGRASFELIQKAWMAGIKIVAAVGAPSSLAAQMAEEVGMTLIGFLREKVFNIYSGEHRIIISDYENSYQG